MHFPHSCSFPRPYPDLKLKNATFDIGSGDIGLVILALGFGGDIGEPNYGRQTFLTNIKYSTYNPLWIVLVTATRSLQDSTGEVNHVNYSRLGETCPGSQ